MAKKKESLADRLKEKLRKLGFSERKAKTLAKGLVPTVRAAIKAEGRKPLLSKSEREYFPDTSDIGKALAALKKVDPGDVIPMQGAKGVDLLQIMDGLSSSRTYTVAAVKSNVGIVAVRKFTDDYYNVKFYPTFEYWNIASGYLEELGGNDFLTREYYQRFHCNKKTLDKVVAELQQAAKPKSRMKGLMDRLKAVDIRTLLKRFTLMGTGGMDYADDRA